MSLTLICVRAAREVAPCLEGCRNLNSISFVFGSGTTVDQAETILFLPLVE